MSKILGTILDEDVLSSEDMQKIYNKLNEGIGLLIKNEADGKSINVCIPVLDALACCAIATIMMAPREDRQATLLAFASRVKHFYTVASKEDDIGEEKSRIVTLN